MNGVVNEFLTSTRTYDYEQVCGALNSEATYPDEFEIPREYTGTLKEQRTSCCVGCVIAQIAEEIYRRKTGDRKEMSEDAAYGMLRSEDSTMSGMLVESALDYWRKIGTVGKDVFNYVEDMPELKKLIQKCPEIYDIAKQNRIGGYASLNYGADRKDLLIKQELSKENPLPLLAIAPRYFGESHCIELVGWNDKTNRYKVKNSHGAKWYDNGFGEIPKTSIDKVYVIIPEEIVLPFTDVEDTEWYCKPIKTLYYSGLVNGYPDNTFRPNDYMTRAEVASLIYNIMSRNDDRFKIINTLLNETTKSKGGTHMIEWVKAAGIRAVKTFAQTAASLITVGAVMSDISWGAVISTACVAAIYSVLTSLAGLPEVKVEVKE